MPSFFDIDSFLAGSEISSRRRRILFLADLDHQANVVQDHIEEVIRHSRHEMVPVNPIRTSLASGLAFRSFDGILIHYSIYVLGEYFLSKDWGNFIRRYRAPKIQIIQDEYRTVNRMARKMSDLGIQVVFSSLSPETAAQVYTQPDVRDISFVGSLPGYVPARLVNRPSLPIKERKLDLIYRGRELSAHLGRAAQEKNAICELGYRIAKMGDFKVDLATAEGQRIYGAAWDNFLSSGRAMLGVEGGVSVFDFDGSVESSISAYLSLNDKATFEEVDRLFLFDVDGKIIHRTITPRCFEAIAARTALILFPGSYRGVLKPQRHYIPLAPDGSNIPEVKELLENHEFLQEMVDRTYEDIIESGAFSFCRYTMAIDSSFERSEVGWPKRTMREIRNHLSVLHAIVANIRTTTTNRVCHSYAVMMEGAALLWKRARQTAAAWAARISSSQSSNRGFRRAKSREQGNG